MAATGQVVTQRDARTSERVGTRAELVYLTLVGLVITGLFVDGWAHRQGTTGESFFSPWHMLLYGAFGATSVTLLLFILARMPLGGAWRDAIPVGYGWAVTAMGLFAIAGVGDFAWHSIVGLEQGIEALLSPTHLLLVGSMPLLAGAPFRAQLTLGRAERKPVFVIFPVVLVAALAAFMTQVVHPFGGPFPAFREGPEVVIGVAGILIQSALAAGAFLVIRRHLEQPPTGTMLAVLLVPASGVALMNDWLAIVIAVALGALAAEVLVRRVRSHLHRPAVLRAAVAAALACLWAAYVGFVALRIGLGWTTHVWAGSIVAGAAVAWAVAWLTTQGDGPD